MTKSCLEKHTHSLILKVASMYSSWFVTCVNTVFAITNAANHKALH